MRACKVKVDYSSLSAVLLCSTNDMARHFVSGDAEKQFAGLILTTKQRFPEAKVLLYLFCPLSIILCGPLQFKMKFPNTFLS